MSEADRATPSHNPIIIVVFVGGCGHNFLHLFGTNQVQHSTIITFIVPACGQLNTEN